MYRGIADDAVARLSPGLLGAPRGCGERLQSLLGVPRVHGEGYGAAMRLIVARCEVVYSGRLNAVLPEAVRLLMLKSDGSFLVHADTGGFKPQNCTLP